MELNFTLYDKLKTSRNILIAGAGGGYDVFCGLPIYFELQNRGLQVHLASFSFSDIEGASHGQRLSKTLVGVSADSERIYPYFPEYYLSKWFKEKFSQEVPIWSFHKTGAIPLTENYQILSKHLDLDAIVLVDGGVDSLMRGDEAHKGTLIEDATSLYAVNELTNIPTKLLACIGLGAEQDISYTQVLENIAALAKADGYLGACALTPQMTYYQAYEQAVLYVQGQPFHDPSVINSSIVSAVRGEFGNYHLTEKTQGSRLWISPLMALYWFFEFEAVVKRNLFLPHLKNTWTFRDVLLVVMDKTNALPKRPHSSVPL